MPLLFSFLFSLFSFLFSLSPLSAQDFSGTYFHVPSVGGVGSTPSDNNYITDMLIAEVLARRYSITPSQIVANYLLVGTIAPTTASESVGFDEPYDPISVLHGDISGSGIWYEETVSPNLVGASAFNPTSGTSSDADQRSAYLFHLYLKDTKKGEILLEQELIYRSMAEFRQFFPILIHNIFNQMGTTYIAPEWCHKLFYFGIGVFWSPRIYIGNEQSTHFGNFGGIASVECQFLNHWSLGVGFEITTDWVALTGMPSDNVMDLMFEIPISLRYVIKTQDYVMLEPYVGAHLNIPFFNRIAPPLVSWMVGFQYNVKLGPGALYINPRFSADFGKSVVDNSYIRYEYQRYIIHIGAGYKYGIITKHR